MLYYATLPFGGAVVGMLVGLRRWLLGSIFLGFIGSLPLYMASAFLIEGKLTPDSLLSGSILAGLIGGIGGAWVWWDDVRKAARRR
jgi:hypothetical protein